MSREVIVKVQVPVVSSDSRAPALIYQIGRVHTQYPPITPELLEFMDGEFKRFALAVWEDDGSYTLLKPLPDQGW